MPTEVPPPPRHFSRNPLLAYLGVPPLIKPRPVPKGPVRVRVTEAMDIAVVINMPRPPGAHLEDDEPPECQIGIVKIPYTDEGLMA